MYVRKGNLENFYKIRIFRPIAFKAIIYTLFDLSFWLFTNSLFKKFRRPEKTFLWGGLLVLFPLVSGYSLILRWKNSGDQKKCPYEVDSFFLTWYIYVLTKKNDCSHFWLILSVYEFFQRARDFFQNFSGRDEN